MSEHSGVSVVVPCYNEEIIIDRSAERILAALGQLADDFEVVFCNDGSTDRTGEKIEALARAHEPVKAVGYPVNQGAGYAFREGLKAVRGQMILHMDADLAIDPSEACKSFLRYLETNDIVIGSRYKGARSDYPLRRRLPSVMYSLIFRSLFGLEIRDAMSGFFGLRREVIERIPALEMDGFEVYLELFYKAQRNNMSLLEVPLRFEHRIESGEISVLRTAPRQLVNTVRLWRRLRLGNGAWKPGRKA